MSKNTIAWRSLMAAASVLALAACAPARPVQQSDAYTPNAYTPSNSYQPSNTAYPVSNGYPTTTTTTVYAPAPLVVNQSQVGYVVTTPQGQTVYTYDRDVPGRSACYGDCVTYWQPVYAPPGAAPTGYYTLINREDGRSQWATSGGMPLYTYTYDHAPGDITGNNYQNTWHAVYISNSSMRTVTSDASVVIQPGTNSRIVTVLNAGTRVAVLDNNAGWTHVQAPGVDGYIPAGSLR
jgi:predicted lipoprotein with Yx(FWY)xxD motif